MNIKPLSSKQYIDIYGGSACPLCLSPNVLADRVDADGSTGTSSVECEDCGSHWVEIWSAYKYVRLNEDMTEKRKEEILRKAKQIRIRVDNVQ
jgi:hypothetical protein